MSLDIVVQQWTGTDKTKELFVAGAEDILGVQLELKGLSRILIQDARGGVLKPGLKDNGDFNIVINGHARRFDYPSVQVPGKIWGVSSALSRCGSCGVLLEPSGDGTIIADPYDGYILAELIGNNLYILFKINDTQHSEDYELYSVYKNILKFVSNLIGHRLPTLSEILSSGFEIPKKLKGLITDKQIADHRRYIESTIAQLIQLKAQAANLKDTRPFSDKIMANVAAIPEIESINVRNSSLDILTHVMYAPDNSNTLRELGIFKMKMSFGDGANITFTNQTRRPHTDNYGSYGHPHVDRPGGYWCAGEGSGIMQLLKEFEVEAAVLFALAAIRSVNEQVDYQRILRSFPAVNKPGTYPTDKKIVSVQTLNAFAKLLNIDLNKSKIELDTKISNLQTALESARQKLFRMTFARSVAMQSPSKIKNNLERLFLELQRNEKIRSISVEDNTLTVITTRLRSEDMSSRNNVSLGPLSISLDFTSGNVNVKNNNPIKLGESKIIQAPNILEENGALPIESTATIAELMGGLEVETVVNIVLDLLGSYDSSTTDPEIIKAIQVA